MLVLASQSPRRREILERAGFEVSIRISGVPEELLPGESAVDYVRRLASAKAWAVDRNPGEIVLGADTVVVLGDAVLEKPVDQTHAVEMLELLSGVEHRVITGICLRHDSGQICDSSETAVRFARLSRFEIEDYARSGEPIDKAGAYGIQGLASKFIERIDGCYFNIVGLPISLVYRHLKEIEAKLMPERNLPI
jgi:septum formation protein